MLVIVILTPGTGAPEESVTVPAIVPDVTCAAEGRPKISHASKTKNGLQENSEMSRETFMVCAPFAKRKPGSPTFAYRAFRFLAISSNSFFKYSLYSCCSLGSLGLGYISLDLYFPSAETRHKLGWRRPELLLIHTLPDRCRCERADKDLVRASR